uniref:Uncharacterized protein LOC109506054 n=1 Tax=Elaeis guineensis var. tenera TaxID=51953 RepID=A0A6J0PLM6_ELAGV|nr:uncharacterized protein LOC109506054 [Elaeis guineensis]
MSGKRAREAIDFNDKRTASPCSPLPGLLFPLLLRLRVRLLVRQCDGIGMEANPRVLGVSIPPFCLPPLHPLDRIFFSCSNLRRRLLSAAFQPTDQGHRNYYQLATWSFCQKAGKHGMQN